MTKSILLTLFIAVFCFRYSFAQPTSEVTAKHLNKELCLLTGFNGGKFGFAELGMSMNRTGTVGFHPYSDAWFISSEINPGKKTIIGPKIGAWVAGGSGGLAIGANLVYYTNFTNSTLVFRPELGIGIQKIKLAYGYNISLTNKSFDLINTNLVSVAYCIRVKKRR